MKNLKLKLFVLILVIGLNKAEINDTNQTLTLPSTKQVFIETTLLKIITKRTTSEFKQIIYENDTKLEVITNWILGLLIAMVVIFAICIIMTLLFIFVTNYFYK